jgi:DNA-binding NarL/FixJ family response regulator
LVNPTATRRTAVLLDPHPLWLDALEQVLRNVGVETVARLTSPRETLAVLETVQPSLLLVDPDARDAELDGLECLRRARARFDSLVVIAFSGSADPMRMEAAFAAGALGYVLKTVAREDLAAAVSRGLNGSPPRRPRAAGAARGAH